MSDKRRDAVVDAAVEFCDAFMSTGPVQFCRDQLLDAVAALRDSRTVACEWCKGSGCGCHFGQDGHPKGLIGWTPCRGCDGR